MGLQTLEFSECIIDSPYFRQKLHSHEKELDKTSKWIKGLVGECKDILNAAKSLSKAQRAFSNTLINFKFECIGSEQTDDEAVIAESLKQFGKLVSAIEDARDLMLNQAHEQIIRPLENFRKDRIGEAKNGKKKFDKHTAKFCQSLEKYLALKTKTGDVLLQEADAAVEMERIHFYQASMEYVVLIQEVQERKKFEFVETLLTFLYGWLTFFHVGHDVYNEFKDYRIKLQQSLQKCRGNFDTTKLETETLMNKMLEVRGGMKAHEQQVTPTSCTREGYLFIEKKALVTVWNKYYCQYQKENKIFTMIPFNQVTGKGITTETFVVTSCTRRASDSIDKRFCFDIKVQDRPSAPFTLQAISEEDCRQWLNAMDGKEPVYSSTQNSHEFDSLLDDVGFNFIKKCISAIEKRGLEEQGLYRLVGVTSKINKLTSMGLDRRKVDKIDLDDTREYEVKTITSGLKNYFRTLPEPLMTYKLHHKFIAASKRESRTLRINDIHELVHQLPEPNFELLEYLIAHLHRVAEQSNRNLMTVVNIAVCFGPTLMRSREETMAAIMNIKFCNIVVEILIDNYEKIFKSAPDGADITNSRVLGGATSSPYTPSRVLSHGAGGDPVTVTPISFTPDRNSFMTEATDTSTPSRARWRSSGGYYVQSPLRGEHTSSTSSSTESIGSKGSVSCQSNSNNAATSGLLTDSSRSPTLRHGTDKLGHCRSEPAMSANSSAPLLSIPSGVKRRKAVDNGSVGSFTGSSSSVSSVSSGQTTQAPRGRTVRTLYSCEAENESELSFEPNQIIQNARLSREPGWLEGVLDGKVGLVPSNYVEYLD